MSGRRPWSALDGCDASDSCLTCPLPECKYDDPAGYKAHLQNHKDQYRAAIISAEHLTIEEAANRFAVSQRSILRLMKRQKTPAS